MLKCTFEKFRPLTVIDQILLCLSVLNHRYINFNIKHSAVNLNNMYQFQAVRRIFRRNENQPYREQIYYKHFLAFLGNGKKSNKIKKKRSSSLKNW